MNAKQTFKIKVKLCLRFITDLWSLDYFKFSKKQNKWIDLRHSIPLDQPIKPSETFENKVFNLSLAAAEINQYAIMPGEIFSFWNIIGNPEKKYKKGRNITNGVLTEAIGGGLCQISGIIYLAGLVSGLEILERHQHSVDIYTDETRFTPLGTDATVVYGYKDLRIKNNYAFPVKFELEVKDNTLNINLLSFEKIDKKTLVFEATTEGDIIYATVMCGQTTVLNKSRYRKLASYTF